MTSPAHAPRGTASDSLLTQINIDNVIQVHNALHKQEQDMRILLHNANRELHLDPAGGDPISAEVTPRFRAKIAEIKAVHWAHVHELAEATERLRQAARHYGFTDDEIGDSFTAHDTAVGPILRDR